MILTMMKNGNNSLVKQINLCIFNFIILDLKKDLNI